MTADGLEGARDFNGARAGSRIEHLTGHFSKLRWNFHFANARWRLQDLTGEGLVLLGDFHQAVNLVVSTDLHARIEQCGLSSGGASAACAVAGAGGGVNFSAVDLAVSADGEAAGWTNVNGAADPAAAFFPFAGCVNRFYALGNGLEYGSNRLKAFASFARNNTLGDGFVGRWNDLQTGACGIGLSLLGDRAQRDLDRLVAQRLRGHQHLFRRGAEGRWNGLGTGGGRTVDHRLFNFAVHRCDHFELFTLRRGHHLLGDGFVAAWNHFDALALGLNQDLFCHVFVRASNRLFAERLGLDYDRFCHRFERGRHRDLTLEFWAHQHLFGHRFGSAGDRDEAL